MEIDMVDISSFILCMSFALIDCIFADFPEIKTSCLEDSLNLRANHENEQSIRNGCHVLIWMLEISQPNTW